MAKEINTIQCPQCQSVKNVKLAENLYLCSNCGTEYFQDKEEEIHVHIHHNKAPKVESFFTKHKKPILLGLFVFLVLMMVLPSLFAPPKQKQVIVPIPPVEKEENKEPEYTERMNNIFSAPQANSENPIVFIIMSRRYDRNRKVEFFARFYDILEDRAFPPIPLAHNDTKQPKMVTFASGKTYLLFKQAENIYEIDFARQELNIVTEQILENIPEFSSGIASVKFTTEDYGFNISTNNGQEYFYYPEINQLFKNRSEVTTAYEQNKARTKAKKALYLFTTKSSDFPDDKSQLIKYWYPDSYPRRYPWRVSWHKNYNLGGGIHVIEKGAPYEKELFYNERNIKFKDLTPDRLYFGQRIVYQDSENLYIKGKVNANKNAKSYVQRINTETGEVEWNFTLKGSEDKFEDILAYKNGLIVNYRDYSEERVQSILKVLDKNGVVLKELNLDTMF